MDIKTLNTIFEHGDSIYKIIDIDDSVIGSGTFGNIIVVNLVKKSNNRSMKNLLKGKQKIRAALKISKGNIIEDKKKFDKIINAIESEVDFSKKMSDMDIGPKYYGSSIMIEDDIPTLYLLMDIYDANVKKVISVQDDKEEIFRYFVSMYKLLYKLFFEANVACFDIKPNNFVYCSKTQEIRMIDFDGRFCFKILEKHDVSSLFICSVIILIITYLTIIYHYKQNPEDYFRQLSNFFSSIKEIDNFIFNKDEEQRKINIESAYNYNKISKEAIKHYTEQAYNVFKRYNYKLSMDIRNPIDTLHMLYDILEQIIPTEITH